MTLIAPIFAVERRFSLNRDGRYSRQRPEGTEGNALWDRGLPGRPFPSIAEAWSVRRAPKRARSFCEIGEIRAISVTLFYALSRYARTQSDQRYVASSAFHSAASAVKAFHNRPGRGSSEWRQPRP